MYYQPVSFSPNSFKFYKKDIVFNCLKILPKCIPVFQLLCVIQALNFRGCQFILVIQLEVPLLLYLYPFLKFKRRV